MGDSPGYLAAIADARRGGRELSVSEAVMRFDLSAATFVVFHSAAGGGVNAACQCSSGKIDWNDTGSRVVGHTDGVTV